MVTCNWLRYEICIVAVPEPAVKNWSMLTWVIVPSNGAINWTLRILYCVDWRLNLAWSYCDCASARSCWVGVASRLSRVALAEERADAALRTAVSLILETWML